MISLTIFELLYLVLTFFTIVIGTLFTLVLIRLLKILKVVTEIADIYFKCKEILGNLSLLPEILKEKFAESFSNKSPDTSSDIQEESK